jgi:hypothetical protein
MKTISWLVCALLLIVPAAQTFGQKTSQPTSSVEQMRIKVAKVGVGEKAKATITKKDGTKVKGFVYRATDEDFEMRDLKTSTPTVIRYDDVTKVDRQQGHSIAKIVLISVAAGTAITLAAVFGSIAANER